MSNRRNPVDVPGLGRLKKIFADLGCSRILYKPLAENDNSKNQIYLGTNFEVLNIFPNLNIRVEDGSKKAIFKAALNFFWVDVQGQVEPASHTKLILYPQYPEVRLSGFLRGCKYAPSKLLNCRMTGRLLLLGIKDSGEVYGFAVSPDSPLARELQAEHPVTVSTVFQHIPLVAGRDVGDGRIIVLQELISGYLPHTIFHAAAYKHVPLVELNPLEGLRNNVFGTRVLGELARKHGVANFVLISTDKAVRPTNVMGASKRLAELVLQALAFESLRTSEQSKTVFSMVRFGNVLGSSGSVVPLFRQQILEGGPITLTDFEVTRYFMTIPEAAQLVIQASAMAKGGEVFVLDMGDPVKIYDLACRMVELSGLKVKSFTHPDGDIEIKEVGLRPGEKLYEELLIGDNPSPTHHPRIMQAQEVFLTWEELSSELTELEEHMKLGNSSKVIEQLKVLVAGFVPDSRSWE